MKPPLKLLQKALSYFIDNTVPCGLVFDRQNNHGKRYPAGWLSTAATGMGLIANSLASGPPCYRLSCRVTDKWRRNCLWYALHDLPHYKGVLPHFLQSHNREVVGSDHYSTIDTAWFVVGAIIASTYDADSKSLAMAMELYERIDWKFWLDERGMIRHGADAAGHFLPTSWDRYSAESLFMYVMAAAAGAKIGNLDLVWHTLGNTRVLNGDCPLFVSQYSLDLLDMAMMRHPRYPYLWWCAIDAAYGNRDVCYAMRKGADGAVAAERRVAGGGFSTFNLFWGLSAGDGPEGYKAYGTCLGSKPGETHIEADGTANIMATVASYAYAEDAVASNIIKGLEHAGALGTYGFSNINLDRNWISPDVVGIDVGAAVMHLDNCREGGRVRNLFTNSDIGQRGIRNLGFIDVTNR